MATAKESPPQGVCGSQTQVLPRSLLGGKVWSFISKFPGHCEGQTKTGLFFFFLHFFTFFFFLCLPSLAGRGPFFTLLSFPASKPRLRVCPHSAPSQLCHCGARSFYRRICRWTGASPEPRSYPSGGGTGLCGTRDSWILMGSFFTFSVERDRHLEGEALSSG